MTKKTYLVTGASDGIGKAICARLVDSDVVIVMHGRNPEKLSAARDEILSANSRAQVHMVIADFAALDEVASLGETIAREFGELNVLINNAGHLTDHWQASKDGLELTFAVNYLAPYLLTRKLLPTLLNNTPARIVNVSSTALGGGYIDCSDLQMRQRFEGWQAYANSKLANVYFSHLLAEKLTGKNLVSNALCPGLIDTNFMHTNSVFGPGGYERMKPMMRPAEQGADVPMHLATAPELAHVTGRFFIRDGASSAKSVPLQWDKRIAEQLWDTSEKLVSDWL